MTAYELGRFLFEGVACGGHALAGDGIDDLALDFSTREVVEEMEADGLKIFDVEHCILTGKIMARQRDRRTREWKYLIEGRTLNSQKPWAVAKIAPTGRLVIITIYLV